jgi:hypothetical protein
MLPILACAVGIYLGLHFNILVLVPFVLLGTGAYVASVAFAGASLFGSLVFVLFPIISLQAGYVLGLTARESYGQLLARLNIGQSKRI